MHPFGTSVVPTSPCNFYHVFWQILAQTATIHGALFIFVLHQDAAARHFRCKAARHKVSSFYTRVSAFDLVWPQLVESKNVLYTPPHTSPRLNAQLPRGGEPQHSSSL